MSQVLSVSLPGSTLYVSGTVNGVETTWTNTTGTTWETTAARSEDDIYRVELTLVSSSGAASTASFTLYYGLHLVTDRTQADVTAGNEKGIYQASDLNRVGAAMSYVAERLVEFGYNPSINPKTDWEDTEWVNQSQAAHYLADLAELRKQITIFYTTPEVPARLTATGPNTKDGLNYERANDIEKILEDIDRLLTLILQNLLYAGEIFSGEV